MKGICLLLSKLGAVIQSDACHDMELQFRMLKDNIVLANQIWIRRLSFKWGSGKHNWSLIIVLKKTQVKCFEDNSSQMWVRDWNFCVMYLVCLTAHPLLMSGGYQNCMLFHICTQPHSTCPYTFKKVRNAPHEWDKMWFHDTAESGTQRLTFSRAETTVRRQTSHFISFLCLFPSLSCPFWKECFISEYCR